MRLSHGQAQEIAERASAIVATDSWGRRVHGATWVDFTVSNELRFALAAADVLGLAEASELIHYVRRHKRGPATVISFPGVELGLSGWQQASSAWRTLDPHFPGDQRLDLPPTHGTTFWGEIGPQRDDWEWTIVASKGIKTWDEDHGTVATEAEAKAAVENWKVPGCRYDQDAF